MLNKTELHIIVKVWLKTDRQTDIQTYRHAEAQKLQLELKKMILETMTNAFELNTTKLGVALNNCLQTGLLKISSLHKVARRICSVLPACSE